MDQHAVPELAIAAFERLHRLLVTVHDRRGTLAPFLDPQRLRHRHPICQAVKAAGFESTCTAHDVVRTAADLDHRPDGRVQVCPAGLVEWVVPVFGPSGIDWIIFAGPRRPGALDATRARAPAGLPPVLRQPPAVDAGDADALLEALRQLAARLQRWAEAGRTAAADPGHDLLRRRSRILRFLAERHGDAELSLADLGRHLGLSPSRASAAVRAACGTTFIAALRAERLATADGLLRHTDLPVAEIVGRCGFADASNFFRAFRRRFAATPLQWRARRDRGA